MLIAFDKLYIFSQIIYEINHKFMEELKRRIGQDYSRLSRMSIVEEGSVKVVENHQMIQYGRIK